ncbi:MAG: hypothetical protein Q4D62_02830 [Planctomycetia bacterium]|nr:hypothetical protein [Planctomycetia bacterium]
MKEMNLLFVGGSHCGKSSLMTAMLRDWTVGLPDWIPLEARLVEEYVPAALSMNLVQLDKREKPLKVSRPADGYVATLQVRRKSSTSLWYWMDWWDFLRGKSSLWKRDGILIHVYELSVQNPGWQEWLAEHPLSQTPLGMVLVVDPFAEKREMSYSQWERLDAGVVLEELLHGLDQVYAKHPSERLPIPTAVAFTKTDVRHLHKTLGGYSSLAARNVAILHRTRDYEMESQSRVMKRLLEGSSSQIQEILRPHRGNFVHLLSHSLEPIAYFITTAWEPHDFYRHSKGVLRGATLPLLWLLGEEMEY